MRTLTHTLALAGGLLLAATAFGQSTPTLSADTIALGDQAVMRIPAGDDASQVPMPQGEGIEVVDVQTDTAGHALLLTLTCFEPGVHYIHLGESDSLPLVVTDVEVDTTTSDIRDIAPLERVPYTFWEIFRWVLLALAVALVVAAAWMLVSRRRRKRALTEGGVSLDTRTPYERATQALEALRRKQLWQAGKTKEYHTELTDILRRFIEECTGIRSTEMTSDETLAALREGGWLADAEALRDIFLTADLVKFAKSEPQPHVHDRSLGEACWVVDALWEKARPVDEENNKEEAAHE